ncbi:MAG: tetratricopeptide repeat protein [Bryobacteraceae bacterium]
MKTILLLILGFCSSLPAAEPELGSSVDWAHSGNILFAANRYGEAQVAFAKALDAAMHREPRNPAQLAVLNINLAATYRLQARYGQAEPLYRKAIEYAESDPAAKSYSRGALRGLTLVCLAEGRLTDAEDFARRDLNLEKRGQTDPAVFAEAANTLAPVLLAEAKYNESEALSNECLGVFPREEWRFHKVSGIALNTLGRISLVQDKNKAAEAYFSQAMEILSGLLGPGDPTVAAVAANLADAKTRLGDWQSATSLLNTSIPTLELTLGKAHPEVASALSTLAAIYKARKQYRKARPVLERIVQIDESVLGPEALKTAVDLNNLGSLAFSERRFQESITLFSRALAINERSLGANHPDTGLVAANLAEAYLLRKRYSEAEPLFGQAIAARERAYGPEDLTLARLLSEYSHVLRANGKFSEAEFAEVRSVRINVRNAIRNNS